MNAATYSPEDNKLRLYVGRVPREEFLKLRAEGWTTLHKQREAGGGDFAATWSPQRVKTCLQYAEIIEDEDMGPEERAADRAERFSGYREKRTDEATGHADNYEAGPQAHGYQSAARAERSAARHDRVGDRAGDAWSKAEYWQRRTAGVISHALYKSTPGVRMGRIKLLEAELRKHKSETERRLQIWQMWKSIEATADADKQTKAARLFVGSVSMSGNYPHPDNGHEASIYCHMTTETRRQITGAEACAMYFSDHREPVEDNEWSTHYKLRLEYETQMLEAQGGRAAFVEMVPGGFIGKRQILKVNKSNATGRVVSVEVMGTHTGFTKESGYRESATRPCPVLVNIERLAAEVYRPPTPAELEQFEAEQKALKAAAPKAAACPLVNPTDEDAEKLQAIWNADARKPSTVLRATQAAYSAASKGGFSPYKTVTISEHGTERPTGYRVQGLARCSVFKVRSGPGEGYESADRVLIITDKPQKPLPWDALATARDQQPSADRLRPRLAELDAELRKDWSAKDRNHKLLDDAAYVGWVRIDSTTQIYWTDEGRAELKKAEGETVHA